MKKAFALFFLLLFSTVSFAQDVIIESSGTRTEAKILTINDTEISYKRFSNLDGPTYTKRIEKIAKIEYENGDVDDFEEQKLAESNIWGDTSLKDLDYDSYKGFLLAPGNVVYIPDGKTEYEKAAVQYLRERIYNDKFWVLASRKEQAHFLIVYEVDLKGRDKVRQTYLQRRDPYTGKEMALLKSSNMYGDYLFGGRYIKTSEDPDENIEAAERLYQYILAIQKNIGQNKKERWHSMFVR